MERTVVITGASSGIGEACATRLAHAGFIVFAGVRKPRDGERLRRALGDRLLPVQLDVTDGASIQGALERVRAAVGDRGVAGLVNNAGIAVTGPIEYVAADALRRQFDVNVFGQVAVIQAFLPLVRQAHGRIINMGSVGAHIAIPFGGVLCATKSAFAMLNDALRLELRPFGVDVVLIEPAAIRTPAVDKTVGDADAAVAALPPEGATRYGAALREFMRRAYARENDGSPPDVVAAAVEHALTTRHPRARYPVGKGAQLLTTLPRLLNDALLDRLRYRLFGLPSKPVTM